MIQFQKSRIGVAVAIATSASSAWAQSRIYLAEYKFNDPKLYRMNLDGTDVEELTVIPSADWLPLGLVVDTDNGKIYWTHGSFNQGAIRRADFDGANVETLVDGLTNARGLAIDFGAGKLYWSDTQDNRIYRANMDGSEMEAIVDGGNQYGRPTLDLVKGHVYFGDFGADEMRRCDLDGNNNVLLFSSGVDDANGVALDLAAGKIYWVDSQTSFFTNYVARADFDGSNLEVLYDGVPISSGLVNIEIDTTAGRIYWADEITDSEKGVWTANLDGSDATRIYASPTDWNAGAIALVLEVAACEGDANGDGAVDPLDSGYALARLGCPVNTGDPTCDAADVNADGLVDPLDVGFILSRLGECQ